MSIAKRFGVALVVVLVALGLARAATFRFQEKEQKIREACRAELTKLGLTRDAAKGKFFTPEIHMVSSGCLTPGQAGEVVVNGKFAPGSQFVIQNDNIEVTKESLVGGQYRANVTVAAGIGPQTASIMAFSPATCLSVQRPNAMVVSAKSEWTLDASNGWRVVARPSGEPLCGDRANGEFPYEVTFFRKGEATAFATRNAVLQYSMFDSTEPYNFSLNEDNQPKSMQDMQALMQKMTDPKLTSAQRDQVMKSLEDLQARLTADMQKMTDPANIAKAEQERQNFGCTAIYANADAAGAVKGRLRCADKVGNRLALSGTVKLLPR
jgi:hypothetical protein